MKSLILYIMTVLIFFSFSNNPRKTKEKTTQETFTQELDSIPAKELEDLIEVPVRKKFDETYSGYYSFKKTENGEKLLHGEFDFIHFDSSAMYNPATKEYNYSMVSVSKIRYTGKFNNGQKDGQFTEKLLFDDGVDIYSKWTVSLDYNNNHCSKGTFKGIFGYIMEETTYHFESIDICTFQLVVEKASELWEIEYEKRKN